CAVQSLLIASLLAERRRRRRVQAALRGRLKFETLLSELSADFTRLPASEIDQQIEKWLQRLSEFLGAGSGGLFELVENGKSDGGRINNSSWAAGTRGAQMPVLNLPIRVDGSSWTLTFYAASRPWPEDLLPRLRVAGEILAGALVRKASVEAL